MGIVFFLRLLLTQNVLQLSLFSTFSFFLPQISKDCQKVSLYSFSIAAVGACDQYQTY